MSGHVKTCPSLDLIFKLYFLQYKIFVLPHLLLCGESSEAFFSVLWKTWEQAINEWSVDAPLAQVILLGHKNKPKLCFWIPVWENLLDLRANQCTVCLSKVLFSKV